MSVPRVTRSTNLRKYDRDIGQAGVLSPMVPYVAVANTALVANRALFGRFVPSRNMTISSMSFIVGTQAGADDAIDVGIYDSSLTRLVSKGATTGLLNAGTGVKNVDITDTALTAGVVYYAAFSSGNQGGSAASLSQISPGNLISIFGTDPGVIFTGIQTSAHPLPSTASLTASTGAIVLALRE